MAFNLPKAEFQISAQDNSQKAFRRVRAGLSDLSHQAQRSAKVIGGVTAAATAAGGAVAYFADKSLNTTQQLSNLSKQTGFSTKRIQELRFAAESMGVQTATMDDALAELSQRMGEAAKDGGEMAEGFKQAGIGVDGLLKRKPNAVFNDLARSIASANSEAEAAAIATKTLGEEAGRQLLPVLREGVDRINELAQSAHEMGLVLDKDTVAGANQAAQELDKLKQVVTLQFTKAIAQLGPDISRFTSELANNPQKVQKFANSVADIASSMTTMAQYGGAAFGSVKDLGQILGVVGRGEVSEGLAKRERLSELRVEAVELRETIRGLTSGEARDEEIAALSENRLEEARNNLKRVRDRMENLREELGMVEGESKEAAEGLDKTGEASGQAAKKQRQQAEASNAQAQAMGKVKDELDSAQEQFENLAARNKEARQLLVDLGATLEDDTRRIGTMNELLASGDITAQDYFENFKFGGEQIDFTTQKAKEAAEATKELGQQQSHTAQIYEDTASSIRSAFSDTFRDMMDEGVGSARQMADRMVAIFKDLAAQLATMKIAGPVIRPMTQGMGAAMGVPAGDQAQVMQQLGMSGGSGGGVGSAVNAWGAANLGTAYGGVGGAQGSQLASQTAGFGGFGQQATSGAAGYGSASASGASLMGIAGAGGLGALGGYTLSGMMGPGGSQNRTAASLLGGGGAAAGMALGGPVGAAIGGAAGGALGSGLFAGDWEVDDQGVIARYSGGDFSGQTFKDKSREGGWFGGGGSKRTTSSLDSDIAGAINRTFDNLEDQIRDMADTLGQDASQALRSFTAEAELSLEGLSDDEITRRLEEWVHGVALSMADSVTGSIQRFERAGESAKQTFQRLVSAVNTWDQTLTAVNQDIALLQGTTTQAATNIANLTDAITQTRIELAGTTDIQKRIELENQLHSQVMDRYQAEKELLTGLQKTIRGIQGDLQSLAGSVSDDRRSITGLSNYRQPGAIQREVNSVSGMLGELPGYDSVRKARQDLKGVRRREERRAKAQEALSAVQNQIRSVEGRGNKYYADWVNDSFNGGHPGRWDKGEFRRIEYGGRRGDLVRGDSARDDVRYWMEEVFDKSDGGYQKMAGLLAAVQSVDRKFKEAKQAQRDYLESRSEAPDLSVEEAQKAVKDAKSEWEEAIRAWSGDARQAVDQLKDLRSETMRYYQAQSRLADLMRSSAASIGDTLQSLRRSQMSPGQRLGAMREDFFGLRGDIRGMEGAQLANAGKELAGLADPLLSQAKEIYATGPKYQELFDRVTTELEAVQSRIEAETPKNYEQATLDTLAAIDDQIGTLESSLQSADQLIVQAINESKNATVGQLQEIRKLLGDSGLTDGSHAAGLPRVPRDGYRAELHAGEAVIDAGTMSALRRYGIPTGGGGGLSEGQVRTIVREVVAQSGEASGEMRLQIVTPDGRVQKEETIRDLYRRSKRGEVVIAADGVEGEE